MNKLSWAKYLLGIWIVAVLISLFVKYVTGNLLVVIPLSLGVYWISVKGLNKINGYQ